MISFSLGTAEHSQSADLDPDELYELVTQALLGEGLTRLKSRIFAMGSFHIPFYRFR